MIVKQHCKVCAKQYSTEYRNWYDRYIPWVCSSHCFVRLVREAYVPLDDRLENDPRVKRFFSPVDTHMRSEYERTFRQWAWERREVIEAEYEQYSFTLPDKSRYVPDFLLNRRVFVEVKGLWNSEGKKKFLALNREFDLPIFVVDKAFLAMLRRTSK